MKGSAALLLASSLVSPTIASLLGKRSTATISNANTPPITVKGNAFFANNQRFYIRGVDYQPGWLPLSFNSTPNMVFPQAAALSWPTPLRTLLDASAMFSTSSNWASTRSASTPSTIPRTTMSA
jgi:Glucanosyltransferase